MAAIFNLKLTPKTVHLRNHSTLCLSESVKRLPILQIRYFQRADEKD